MTLSKQIALKQTCFPQLGGDRHTVVRFVKGLYEVFDTSMKQKFAKTLKITNEVASNKLLLRALVYNQLNFFLHVICVQNENVYYWSDNWHVIYTNWDVGQPNRTADGGGCVGIVQQGTWRDSICSQPMPFLCKITTGQLSTLASPLLLSFGNGN